MPDNPGAGGRIGGAYYELSASVGKFEAEMKGAEAVANHSTQVIVGDFARIAAAAARVSGPSFSPGRGGGGYGGGISGSGLGSSPFGGGPGGLPPAGQIGQIQGAVVRTTGLVGGLRAAFSGVASSIASMAGPFAAIVATAGTFYALGQKIRELFVQDITPEIERFLKSIDTTSAVSQVQVLRDRLADLANANQGTIRNDLDNLAQFTTTAHVRQEIAALNNQLAFAGTRANREKDIEQFKEQLRLVKEIQEVQKNSKFSVEGIVFSIEANTRALHGLAERIR